MSNAARSVFVFGVYLLVLGAGLMTIPNLVLAPFGVPATTEVWIRVVGVLVVCLGYYYTCSARAGNLAFCRFTAHARAFVFVSFAALVALRLAHPALALFGTVDLLGAAWTLAALRHARGGAAA
jgi:hypothetical protein